MVYLKVRNKTVVYIDLIYTLKIEQNLCQDSIRSCSSGILVRMKSLARVPGRDAGASRSMDAPGGVKPRKMVKAGYIGSPVLFHRKPLFSIIGSPPLPPRRDIARPPAAHLRQSTPDSGLGLSLFPGKCLVILFRCSRLAQQRPHQKLVRALGKLS